MNSTQLQIRTATRVAALTTLLGVTALTVAAALARSRFDGLGMLALVLITASLLYVLELLRM